MVTVNIQADSKFPVNRVGVRSAVRRVTDGYGLRQAQVGVVVVGGRKIAELNKQWLKREGMTDVLSFPLEGGFDEINGLYMLGDVVVCWPMAVKQAGEKNILVDEEIDALVEHGVRHLLGEHHD
ncbi:MAG: rRNA maturation RNase YbeY [Candidatus Chisholmbacteria bacterium RIFCSPHIGHO2_01_FULL_48_12]|uniref:rRNA maturation RNase YbeY n=1 Tax=Candidatus Chisholmbacteria bacterium RIFCSPHIGHO2_01_FULL_48_12 TaxID=1797589 RepID=A0A1G1VQM7_9BACT|nr:MAG: rRNA maturation RNase YbeY [Candidatus Chisholmbacteria bacterium RIFCSPHIGHO2_01_FULL_48_12]